MADIVSGSDLTGTITAQPPSSLDSGDTATATFSVSNSGDPATGTISASFDLVPTDNTTNDGDTIEGVGSASASIADDVTTPDPIPVSFTVPANTPPGTYDLVGTLTAGGGITDTNTSDKTFSSTPITITGSVDGSFTAGIPERVVATGQLTPTLELTNESDSAVSGNLSVQYDLSTSPTINSSAVSLGTLTDSLDLAAGATTDQNTSIQLPSSEHPGNYYLLAQLSGVGADSTVASSEITIVPKLVTIITPGLLTGPDAPGGENIANFTTLKQDLDGLVQSGSALYQNTYSEVDPWLSTQYFLPGLLALAAEQFSLPPANVLLSSLVSAAATLADQNAQSAADAEYQHLVQNELVDTNDIATSGPNQQIIDLIGHSRGANLNALLAQRLSDNGYVVDQFTSLDGFSSDWPSPANQLSHESIAALVAGSKISGSFNYEVQAGIFDTGGVIDQLVYDETGEHLSVADLTLLSTAFPNEKAPSSSAFTDSVVVPGSGDGGPDNISNHLNITQLFTNGSLLEINSDGTETYEFEHRDDPAIEGSVSTDSAQNARAIASIAAADTVNETSFGNNFVDGNFAMLGSLLRQPTSNSGIDAGAQALLSLFSNPTDLLGALWDVNGTASLVQDGTNTGAQLAETGDTSIGQTITPTGGSENIDFSLSNITANSGDEVEVFFGSQMLGSVPLQGATAGPYSVPLSGVGTAPGELSFKLTGPTNAGAVVALEDLAVVNSSPVTTSVSVTSSAARVSIGTAVTLTATVIGARGGATPTGVVTFLADGTQVGQGTVDSGGNATLTTTSLPAGALNVTASYGGDFNYAGSVSPGVAQIINAGVLTPTIGRSTFATQLVAGVIAKGVVAVTLTSTSASLERGAATIRVYASPNGAIDGAASVIGSLKHSVSLKQGHSTAVAVRVSDTGLSDGTYFLVIEVVDPSGKSSYAMDTTPITVTPANVALSAAVIAVAPASLKAGSSVTVTVTISNSGNITAAGSAKLALGLSNDSIVSASPVITIKQTVRIKPSGKLVLRLKFRTKGLASGSYYPSIDVLLDSQTASAVSTSPIKID